MPDAIDITNSDDHEAGGRIKAVRLAAELNQADFAARLGVKQAYLSALETGRRDVTANILKALHQAFGVSLDWVITGEGDMNMARRHAPIVPTADAQALGQVSRMRLEHALRDPAVLDTLQAWETLPLAELSHLYGRVGAGLDERTVSILLKVISDGQAKEKGFSELSKLLSPLIELQSEIIELRDQAQALTEALRTYADSL